MTRDVNMTFIRKDEGKRPFGRSKQKSENNTEMALKQIG
jgi:hypothetical protein